MNPYADVIKKHAERAVRLYKEKMPEISKLCRLRFQPDGGNSATAPGDVGRYLEAIAVVGGNVAKNSANMALRQRANELGITGLNL